MTNGGGPHGHGSKKTGDKKSAGEATKSPAKKVLTANLPKKKPGR